MIFAFGSFEKIKFYETGLVLQIGISGFPDFLKFGFLTLDNAKAVHGNILTHMMIKLGRERREANFFDFMSLKFYDSNKSNGENFDSSGPSCRTFGVGDAVCPAGIFMAWEIAR